MYQEVYAGQTCGLRNKIKEKGVKVVTFSTRSQFREEVGEKYVQELARIVGVREEKKRWGGGRGKGGVFKKCKEACWEGGEGGTCTCGSSD